MVWIADTAELLIFTEYDGQKLSDKMQFFNVLVAKIGTNQISIFKVTNTKWSERLSLALNRFYRAAYHVGFLVSDAGGWEAQNAQPVFNFIAS